MDTRLQPHGNESSSGVVRLAGSANAAPLRLAARSCRLPISFLTAPVGDRHRLVAGFNLPAPAHVADDPLLGFATRISRAVEIQDVSRHEILSGSPLLAGASIRFLAGAPACCSGASGGGMLWVAGHAPGSLSREDWEALFDAAALCARDQSAGPEDEEALRFRSVFESASVGIALIRLDGELIDVNPALERMTGYTAVELRSMEQAIQRLTHPDDKAANRHLYRELLQGRQDSFQTEKRYVRKDGTAFWGRLNASLVRDGAGAPHYVIGMVEDITPRKTAKLALRASVRRYRNLFQQASDGIIIAQMDGRITDVNARMCEMLGHTREAMIGMALTQVITPDNLRKLPFVWDRIRAGERVIAIEREYMRSDGSTFPVEVTVSLIERSLVQCIVRDVTARKAHEAGLIEARERAEEVARVKNILLTNISHELRTPLSTIIGCADVLVEEADEMHRELAGMVSQGGHRLMKTLNAVVELARLESNDVKPAMRNFDLSVSLWEWLRELQPSVEGKGLFLEYVLPEGSVPVRTDEQLIREAVRQLVGNAAKFTETGGVTVRLGQADGYVAVSISDTGPGITPEYMPRVFEPFQQESSGLDRTYEGVGLGLAVTRRAMQLLHGEIRVESVKGNGATFTILLPQSTDLQLGAQEYEYALQFAAEG